MFMKQAGSISEKHSSHLAVKMGSDRAFGAVFAVVFAVICLLPLKTDGEPRLWAGMVAAVFVVMVLICPSVLSPLNRFWFLLGMALHRIVSPVVMGLMFFVAIYPMAVMLRVAGKDPMRLKRDETAASYWILRQPPDSDPDGMRRQF